MFRLVGPAAELIRIERHHGVDPGSAVQFGLRQRFTQKRWGDSQVDFDSAYSLLMAWTCADTPAATMHRVNHYWTRACETFGYGLMWGAVERGWHFDQGRWVAAALVGAAKRQSLSSAAPSTKWY
jgi:hypothetical protein